MALDLTPLRNAVAALDRSMDYLRSEMAKDPDLREQFRAAAIQAFEFTHELAFKMLRRHFDQTMDDPTAVDRMSYMELVRSAAEAGFINDVARFRQYRDMRNLSSHTYNEPIAEKVATVLDDFRRDVGVLLDELERRSRASGQT